MAGTTPRLGLAKPDDETEEWGDDYRAAMDILDAHPGIKVVDSVEEIEVPYEGQMAFERDSGRYLGFTSTGWDEVGPPSVGRSVTFPQMTPTATWVIEHNLGGYPSITITDSAGDVVVGQVRYPDNNTAVVNFAAPFSGTAFLN